MDIINALARLQLAAIECGGRIRLHTTDPALRALLELFGLTTVLGCGDAEEGEERGILERVQPGDLVLPPLHDDDRRRFE